MNRQKMQIDTTRTSYSNFPRDMKQSIKTKIGTCYLVKSQVQKDKTYPKKSSTSATCSAKSSTLSSGKSE